MKTYSERNIDGGMFDFQNYYSQVAELLPDGARIAEVGVANGASAIYLAEELTALGKNFTLTMIDDLSYGKELQLNEIMKNIIQSGVGENIHFVPECSLNASCKWADGSFHFVFIDASHRLEETKADIRLWIRKVMDGGVLAGHDYQRCPAVFEAVNEVANLKDIVQFSTSKGYGIWAIKKTPELEIK